MTLNSEEITVNNNNKLIAAFDGWVDKTPFINSDKEEWPWFVKYDEQGQEIGDIKCVPNKYHSSWDWLMPVWKKAGSWLYEKRAAFTQLDYTTAHRITKEFIDACQKADIDAAYLAIIEAVTFINELTYDDTTEPAGGDGSL